MLRSCHKICRALGFLISAKIRSSKKPLKPEKAPLDAAMLEQKPPEHLLTPFCHRFAHALLFDSNSIDLDRTRRSTLTQHLISRSLVFRRYMWPTPAMIMGAQAPPHPRTALRISVMTISRSSRLKPSRFTSPHPNNVCGLAFMATRKPSRVVAVSPGRGWI